MLEGIDIELAIPARRGRPLPYPILHFSHKTSERPRLGLSEVTISGLSRTNRCL